LRANVGTGVKPLHVGFAARDGVAAARLAAAGVTARPMAVSGPHGFLAVMGVGARPAETIADSLGTPFDIDDPGFTFKIYPSCGETHAAVDAALLLREKYGLAPDGIKHVRAGIAPLAATNLTYHRPETPAQC
jgi:2-methylcitrate dehydratase PrpD